MKNAKKAVLCIDLDGTLINAEEKIHPQDVTLLQDFPEDIQPVLNTGRSLHTARAVLHQNGLFNKTALPFPGVFMNGGAAYLPHEVFCTKHTFSPSTLDALIDLSKAYPEAGFTFFTLGEVFLVNPNAFARHISQIHYLDAREVNPKHVPEEVIKLMILDQDQDTLYDIKAKTENWDVVGAYSLPYAFEINPPGISKANTLQDLLQVMSHDHLPIFAAGDNENDLSMFNLSQISFAPASSHPSILDAADHIIEREKDGLLLPILEQIRL